MPDFAIQPPRARPLSGGEAIAGTDATVREFWAWALSDQGTTLRKAR